MSNLDKEGMLLHERIMHRRFPGIEKGSRKLEQVAGIVIHQTDSSNEQATFNAYNSGGNGAHFLIAKDGRIFQTASVLQSCAHVGRLIKAKCLEIDARSCDADTAKFLTLQWRQQIEAINKNERGKGYPERYPVNGDSIGIEIVGKSIDTETYENVTSAQGTSLQFLLDELFRFLPPSHQKMSAVIRPSHIKTRARPNLPYGKNETACYSLGNRAGISAFSLRGNECRKQIEQRS